MSKTIPHAIVATFLATLATAAPRAQAPDLSKSANPELVGSLAKELGATAQQAEGAAGALFDVAKSRLSPGDWGKVSQAVPGIDGLLKAAPAVAAASGAAGALSKAGGLGNATAAFQKLGLKPEMVMKAIPILTQYVTKSGGAGVGSLLAGVLK
jgi:hypothetical protein